MKLSEESVSRVAVALSAYHRGALHARCHTLVEGNLESPAARELDTVRRRIDSDYDLQERVTRATGLQMILLYNQREISRLREKLNEENKVAVARHAQELERQSNAALKLLERIKD